MVALGTLTKYVIWAFPSCCTCYTNSAHLRQQENITTIGKVLSDDCVVENME